MKKLKIILIILFFFLINNINAYCAQNNQKIFENDIKKCEQNGNASCYANLSKKYKNQEQNLFLIYKYAKSLWADEKEYTKSKEYFNYIIQNGINNPKLVESSKKEIRKLNELQKNILIAQRNDNGDYYDPENALRWENPQNIRVYISSKTGKEYIFHNALKIYNNNFQKTIKFFIVNNPNDFDIEMKFVNNVPEHWGWTDWKYKKINNKKYLTKAYIKIGLKTDNGNFLSDTNYLQVTLHEIGHALGLPHCENLNDIMCPKTRQQYQKHKFSKRDKNTLLKTYR